MKKIVLGGCLVLLVLVAARGARAEFALGDDDRVAFFGNKVLTFPRQGMPPEMPWGVETFVRIRYPELKTRFRTYGRHAAAMLKDVVKRFDTQVAPYKPTVVVLCFGTDDVPQQKFNESHLNQFQADFAALVDHVKQTGARVYVMTPLCPEVTKKRRLKSIQYDETLGRYAEAMRTIAREQGAQVIDWFAASKAYSAAHPGERRFAITGKGAAPSTLGSAIGMTAMLDAWGAEPCNITVIADWNSDSVSASLGQASVTKISDDKIKLKLSGMPIPWVVPNRGTITEEDWPGTKYYSFVLRVLNVPEGGIMISEPGGKNALPYLSQQLRQGTDMGFVGPLVKLDAVKTLAKWVKEKYVAFGRQLSWMPREAPEPEYAETYQTYNLGLQQFVDATDRVVLRQPRTIDVTLELYKAPLPPAGALDKIKKGAGSARKPPKKRPAPKAGERRKPLEKTKPAETKKEDPGEIEELTPEEAP